MTGGIHKSGGIQRFKLGLHGAKQTIAVLIGYVQEGEFESWREQINAWVRDLAIDSTNAKEKWSIDEQLTAVSEDRALKVSNALSVHERVDSAISPKITIQHFWILMQN